MENDGENRQCHETLVDLDTVCLHIADRILIRDFTLRVERGIRVGITGPSGCGKTTLLRSIVKRQLAAGSTAKRFILTPGRIGYAPQQGGMLPWYSVKQNLGVFSPVNKEEKDRWCKNVLEIVELTQVGSAFPSQLSGGELQRARLACAIATQPTLYCADEPLTEVGLQQKWKVLERWSFEMNERRSGLVLVSHDIDTLIYLCDKIIVLGGQEDQPSRILTRFNISTEGHPRSPANLNCSSLKNIRHQMINTLYLRSTDELKKEERSNGYLDKTTST